MGTVGSNVAANLRALVSRWAERPYWAASMLLLIVAIMISGPWSCIVHCWIIEMTHAHELTQHAHGTHLILDTAHKCATEMHSQHPHAGHAPEALTIAVLLPIAVVPMLLVAAFSLQQRAVSGSSVIHPPPLEPPRHSVSFA